jgi:alanyl-tRNA synthetase
VGDSGFIQNSEEKISILDTKKENNLIVHIAPRLPKDVNATFNAVVNVQRRSNIANNHTTTHLLHKALRKVLGTHVEQKGSLVHPDYLRFDFSHYQKVSSEELREIEHLVNADIRSNHGIVEHREVPLEKAREMGALALFGEKYGDLVRTIGFGDSVELCGGTHVKATGQIGLFFVLSEGSVSAGVRRIEAVTGLKAEELFDQQRDLMEQLGNLFKTQSNLRKNIENLIDENSQLSKQRETMMQYMLKLEKRSLLDGAMDVAGVKIISGQVKSVLVGNLKDLAFQIRNETDGAMVGILGGEEGGKAQLAVILSESLMESDGLNAVELIRAVAKEIQGGGGGQPFFASAGGKNPAGIEKAIDQAVSIVKGRLA